MRASKRSLIEASKAELSGADLGDQRLDERLLKVVAAIAANPDKGLPRIFGDPSALEAAYRLFSNKHVQPEDILEPHRQQTLERAAAVEGRVVVAHDSSEFGFGGEREQLGRLSRTTRGFIAHVALAIRGEDRSPLGVVGCETLLRPDHSTRGGRRKNPTTEALRWSRMAEEAHRLLPKAVHVMDREADSYALMAEMSGRGQDYIVRLCQKRRLLEGGKVPDLLPQLELLAVREIPLTARPAFGRNAKSLGRYPARKARRANIRVTAGPVVMKRATDLSHSLPKELQLTLVHVSEIKPPEDQPAVEWILYTTLPANDALQALAIVDAYRCRWLIEEYFKALKTGCAVEKRQLESPEALANLLAVTIPIAWLMLRLRSTARGSPDAPASSVLTPTQLTCLRLELKHRGKPWPASPTAHDVLLAVARLGGHLPQNGEPGWLTLGRGLQDLLMLERGYLLREAINP